MAEAVDIAASTLGAIQAINELTLLLHGHAGTYKRVPQDCLNLIEEFSLLTQILHNLHELDHGEDGTKSLSLLQLDDPLKDIRKMTEELLQKLSPQNRTMIMWPLKESTTQQVLLRIGRQKQFLTLGLEAYSRQREIVLQTDVRRSRVLEWIYPEAFDTKHIEISERRQENTGKWFLEADKVRDWIVNQGMLWGYGIPGAGKTFLASLMIDHLRHQATRSGYGVAYIYFGYRNQERQKQVSVLASLIKQLALQIRDLPRGIEELYNKLAFQEKRPTVEELYNVLLAFRDFFSRIFLVFDALDECNPESQRRDLLPLFHRMNKDSISIFFTSRQHPEGIQDSFANSAKIQLSAKDEDIAIYIKQKIRENPRANRLIEKAKCEDELISRITDNSSGMFLLACFHTEHICQQTTVKQVLNALHELDHSMKRPLAPTYDRVMKSLLSQGTACRDLAFRIFIWLAKARRMLTVRTIQQAIAIDPGRIVFEEIDIPDRITIFDVCAGLVSIDERSDTVRFAHYTVQEYLLMNALIPESGGFTIAMTCITFLCLDIFAGGACPSDLTLEDRLRLYPFLEYAAQELSFHLKECDEASTTDSILKFIARPGNISSYLQVLYLGKPTNKNLERYNRYPRDQNPLHLVATIGHCSVARLVLEDGADIMALDNRGWTALHCAAFEGHESMVRLLLEEGAEVGALDKQRQTSLYCAVLGGHGSVVRLLLENGADISATDNSGYTLLHCAAIGGFAEVVQPLLEHDADISATDNHGRTVLHCAGAGGFTEVARVLIKYGANISATDDRGYTPLHCTATGNFGDLTQLLIDNDVDVSAVDNRGYTALHCAAAGGFTKVTQILIDNGADISATDNRGYTPLHCVVNGGFERLAQLLMENGADTSATDSRGCTPLHCAATGSFEEVTRLLIQYGADISAADDRGYTPLHSAATGGCRQLVVLLLENGGNPSVTDINGSTPLNKAASGQHQSVVRLLLEKGAGYLDVNLDENAALCLARGLNGLCHYGKALGLFERVLVSQEMRLGKEHLDTIDTIREMVSALSHLRKYDKAIEYLERVYASEQGKLGWEHPDTLTTAHKITQVLGHLERYAEMYALSKKILASRERVLGKENVDTLSSAYNIAWALNHLGKFEEALEFYGKILTSRVKILGSDHLDTLTTIHSMILALENLRRYEEVLELLKQVLVIQEKILGKEHRDTLTTIQHMGQALCRLEMYEEALQLYQDVSVSQKRIFGDEHPDTLRTSHNMAQTLSLLKRFRPALELYRQVLVSRRTILGNDHSDTLDTAHNMAHTLCSVEEYQESVELYAQVLATREKVLGQRHSLYLDTAYNMAQALSHLNRYEQALELYRLVVTNRKKILGDEHVDTLSTVHEMARVLQCIRLYEEALVLYQQALSGREKTLGRQHPDTMNTTSKMAETLNSLGRYEEALEFYEQVLPDRQDILEDNSGILATAHGIAKILAHLGRYEEAVALYEKVLPGHKKILGNNHPDTLVTSQDMAYVLSCLGRYVEALELYGGILDIQENQLGKEHPDFLNTVQSMAFVYEKGGWLKSALELYQDVLINRRRILGDEHPDTLDTACRVNPIIEYLCDEGSLGVTKTSKDKDDVLTGSQRAEQFSDNEIIGKEYLDTLKIVDKTMATPARSNPHIVRDQETFRSIQQTIATQGELPKGEYLKTLEQINETTATTEELGSQNESPKFDDQVLCSPATPLRDEGQNTLDIISFLRRQAKLFEDATWKVKYKISALEFLIIRELESYKPNRELPIRVRWECVCGIRLFDDFREFNDRGPAAQCVLGLNQRTSGVDSITPTLGLPDLFSFPTKAVLGDHCPLDFFSFLFQVLFGGLSLPGFFLSLRAMWGGNISSIHPASQVSYPTQGGTSNPTLPPSVHLTQMGGNSQHPQQGSTSSSYPALVQPPHALHNRLSCAQVSSTSSSIDHLLLCFNDESVYFQSLQLGPSTSDQQIFTAIREEYYKRRGWWRSRFSFEVLKRVEFVKFEIYYQNRVEIRARGDLPPVNNMEYKYLPRPAEMIPPVPGFMYFFHKPECAPTSDHLLTKMPKKVSALRGLGCGWGIHFIEEPCMFRIYMLAVFIVVIDSIFAVVWSVLKKDIQGGFGVAAFITSVGAIFMAIGWRQVVET